MVVEVEVVERWRWWLGCIERIGSALGGRWW